MRTRTSLAVAALAVAGALNAAPAEAGCGCAKPPPPRAAVRPFVGHADQKITLFNDQLAPGTMYWVQFTSTVDGTVYGVDSDNGRVLWRAKLRADRRGKSSASRASNGR